MFIPQNVPYLWHEHDCIHHRRADMNVLWDKHQYLCHEHVSTTGGQTGTFCRINISTYAMSMYPPQEERQGHSIG
jgi:hypothetical protein